MPERHGDPLAGYRWVEPPPNTTDRSRPIDRRASLPADSTELHATEVWTGDLQAVLALDDLALPGRERTTVEVEISAMAPSALAPLPPGVFADGNAYEIILMDDKTAIAAIEPDGRLILKVPHPATAVLHSPDGSRWLDIASDATSAVEIEASFAQPGFYLAVTDHPLSESDGGFATSTAVLALVAPVVLLIAVLVATRRRRGRS